MPTLRQRVEQILDGESRSTGVIIVRDGKLLASRDPLDGGSAALVVLDPDLPGRPAIGPAPAPQGAAAPPAPPQDP